MSGMAEGSIRVRLRTPEPRRYRDAKAQIHNQRPLAAPRLLHGKTPQQALEIIRLLFTLCGQAQREAAAQALAQATGAPLDAEQRRLGALRILMETAREQLLGLLRDLPPLLGQDCDPALLQQLQRLRIDEATPDRATSQIAITRLEALLEQALFGRPAEQWLRETDHIEALCRWIETHDSPPARCLRRLCDRGWVSQADAGCPPLPRLDHQLLLEQLADPAFSAQPLWQQVPHETGCLPRQRYQPLIAELMREFGHGLLTRFCARLTELAELPGRMHALIGQEPAQEPPPSLPEGWGMAQVEAARGRLVHAVEIRDGRIQRYHIIAPTEWNFHPRGAASRCLGRLHARNHQELDRLARLTMHAIDPCVGYHLEIA